MSLISPTSYIWTLGFCPTINAVMNTENVYFTLICDTVLQQSWLESPCQTGADFSKEWQMLPFTPLEVNLVSWPFIKVSSFINTVNSIWRRYLFVRSMFCSLKLSVGIYLWFLKIVPNMCFPLNVRLKSYNFRDSSTGNKNLEHPVFTSS